MIPQRYYWLLMKIVNKIMGEIITSFPKEKFTWGAKL
jgi:hypothetical protein